jgi:hypothetical protein
VALQPGAKDIYHDKFAVVVFLHSDSDDEDVVREGRKCYGKADFCLLQNIGHLP